ncbi:MAG: RrF2 family transcriptional regulator [Candidatus Hinthialibacter sp.]
MHNLLRVSDAVSLAFHTLWLLAEREHEFLRTPEIAKLLSVSEHHLQKVHQRLTKAGFIRAVRGPKGGFTLNRPAEEITLMQIYEAIDGPLETTHCMLGRSTCRVKHCRLSELVKEVNHVVRRHFEKITLADLAKSELANSLKN